jgi:peroxiredoxin
MPWNVALWFALARLRLAVEADCDQRVLRAHPDVRAYGSLLVDVSERRVRRTLPLVALVESASHLGRRVALMTARTPRLLPLRIAGAALVGCACVAAACKAPRPDAVRGSSMSLVTRDTSGYEVAPLPPMHATTIDGRGIARTMADYKGKVVLLYIWETWCAPCQLQLKQFEQLHREFGPQGLAVVAVSLDDSNAARRVRDSVKAMGLTFEVLHDPTRRTFFHDYQTGTGLPETYVIGREGSIRFKMQGWGRGDRESPWMRRLIQQLVTIPKEASVPPPRLIGLRSTTIASPGGGGAAAPRVLSVGQARRAVVRFFPAALTGGLGKRPYLWFAADDENRILSAAAGRQALQRDSSGSPNGVTWESVRQMLVGIPRSPQPGDVVELREFEVGNDTVSVVWARLGARLPTGVSRQASGRP